jgi:hypothetical protein
VKNPDIEFAEVDGKGGKDTVASVRLIALLKI